jgi:hypothetical protein
VGEVVERRERGRGKERNEVAGNSSSSEQVGFLSKLNTVGCNFDNKSKNS